jgi:hypothetical protein
MKIALLMLNKILCFLVIFCCCNFASAQIKTTQNDSTKVYKNIEKFAKKNNFRRFVHKLFFTDTNKSKPKKISKKNNRITKAFQVNEGKIIRNINITTLDPFGYSETNKDKVPNNFLEKIGNDIHFKTKNFTIRNLILIKKNQTLDSLLAKETERLIRRQRYVRSVIIEPITIANSKDSVDIDIRVLDSWSLIPNGSISSSRSNLEIAERNFIGLGHELDANFDRRFADNAKGNNIKYSINNIKNSFINTTFYYEDDFESNTRKSVKIERDFYSQLTQFAGGIFIENRRFIDSLPNNTGDFEKQLFKLESQNYWFGHAFNLFPKSSRLRTTNFVSTIGFQNTSYLNSPKFILDTERFFSSERLYLTSIGLSSREFVQDKFLFNYDLIEDVPIGKVYSITLGFQDKNLKKRTYFGARFAYGDYFKIGYLGTNIEWGSFFNNGLTEETTFRIEANYFTDLYYIGNWKIRQFIKPKVILGNNRNSNFKDQININENNGISGFNSPLLLGTRKWVSSFLTQTYSPGNWKGFHFNPFLNISLGMIGNKNDALFNKKLYSSFGIGVLINNEYLVFNSFQLSFAFYPSIPNEGMNIFKTNSFKNDDLSIPNYDIGKPNIVPYN